MDRKGGYIGNAGALSGGTAVECPQYLNPGSYTFTAPRSGKYKFVAWGAGGNSAGTISGTVGGSSGAYGEVTKALTTGQTVTITNGAPPIGSANAADTTLTFPDSSVCTAGAAQFSTNTTAGAAGVASGVWDYSLNGSLGGVGNHAGTAGLGTGGGAGGTTDGTHGGGAGAPARLPYLGAAGGAASSSFSRGPGAGQGCSQGGGLMGSAGAVIVQYVGS